jgi:hypothetical protein
MAFTRFHDDPARIEKALLESTFTGMYHLNTPGNGCDLPFISDPHIRMQKWGANLQTNSLKVENELRGMNRPLDRDSMSYRHPPTQSKSYPTQKFGTDETRASNPAWLYRDKTQAQFAILPLDPQANVFIPFNNNTPSRMLEKDHYKSQYY